MSLRKLILRNKCQVFLWPGHLFLALFRQRETRGILFLIIKSTIMANYLDRHLFCHYLCPLDDICNNGAKWCQNLFSQNPFLLLSQFSPILPPALTAFSLFPGSLCFVLNANFVSKLHTSKDILIYTRRQNWCLNINGSSRISGNPIKYDYRWPVFKCSWRKTVWRSELSWPTSR